jgi:hypothetical protein
LRRSDPYRVPSAATRWLVFSNAADRRLFAGLAFSNAAPQRSRPYGGRFAFPFHHQPLYRPFEAIGALSV